MAYSKLNQLTLYTACITFIACSVSYLFIDQPLASIAYYSLPKTYLYSIANFIGKISEPSLWAGLFLILAIISSICFIRHHHNKKLYIITLSLFIAILVATLLKYTLARYRPILFLEQNLYGFHGFSMKNSFNSFPSGHATLAFAGLLGFSNIFNKKSLTITLIMIACIIAISRIIMAQHYLSDVIAGSYIGIFAYLWAQAVISQKLSTPWWPRN